ncbi:hypothetical protein RCG23_02765 [Neobacillus sp. PS3-34]|uniref:hypothetical protein n=1 Tax=Neobacillus sp. PS3-34 TaxID=3070678 RepID=UPI0027DFD412|nr:hypothetical protein [Neobacillus sp. PS3-34]WML49046.1 hypothetical protein RCG23_02765 [Neobacillus sp. PS3-34]
MKRILATACWILFCGSSLAFAEKPTEDKQTLVVGNEKEGVYLYATPDLNKNLYKDFRVKIENEMVETQGWEVEMREERQPELHVIDLNHDGKKEIVVILPIGTGTWVVVKEAHILQQVETLDGKRYEEMDIDNPVHTIERDFKITATNKTIQVKGRGHVWKVANICGKTYYRHRFPLYQSVNWKVKGNNLMADVGLTIKNNCVPAGFILSYKQRGEIYIAKHVKVNL